MVNLLKTKTSGSSPSTKYAEEVAVSVFGFLVREPEYLAKFATQTGVEMTDIPALADTPLFLHAVLGFVLSDHSLLLTYCQSAGEKPEIVNIAHQKLGGNDALP